MKCTSTSQPIFLLPHGKFFSGTAVNCVLVMFLQACQNNVHKGRVSFRYRSFVKDQGTHPSFYANHVRMCTTDTAAANIKISPHPASYAQHALQTLSSLQIVALREQANASP